MRRQVIRGGMHGLIFLMLSYAIVYFYGYGRNSLISVLYITLLACIWMEVKDHLEAPDINFLHRLVIVSEEEKLKMRKLATGEKYEISGNVKKLD